MNRFLISCLATVLITTSPLARAEFSPLQSADALLVDAHQAWKKRDAIGLEKTRVLLLAIEPKHPLLPWIEHWQWRQQLLDPRYDGGRDTKVAEWLARNSDLSAADTVRRDFLRSLIRRLDVAGFERELSRGIPRLKDPQIDCFSQKLSVEAGREAFDRISTVAMIHSNLGDGCLALTETLLQKGHLKLDDVWSLIRSAIEQGKGHTITRLAEWLPDAAQDALKHRSVNPKKALKSVEVPSPPLELALLTEIARQSMSDAESRLERRVTRWPKALQAEAWLTLSAMAARKLDPVAVHWAERATLQPVSISDESLAWVTRAALRSKRWPLVIETIDRMSAPAQQEPVWTYWRARALEEQGRGLEARSLLETLIGGDEFYHLLAREALGLPAAPESTRIYAPEPSPVALAKARKIPGLNNAFRLLALDIRPEGVWEFNRQLLNRNDAELLAIAAVAREAGFLDRMITAADRTRESHDYRLRYPTPLSEILVKAAQSEGLSPYWVYGLIRQESRFTQKARSNVGASGLMQLMPATAIMVAKKIGLPKESVRQIDDPEINAKLGTAYLKQVAQQLDRSAVMASAAYNAGPGRPRQWRANLTQAIEGAAFAESIPFNETRDYVKRVLTNTVLYASTHDRQNYSLRKILGDISATEAQTGLQLCCQ